MRLHDVVETSQEVAATSSRNAKRDALAELLSGRDPRSVETAVAMLTGELRQGRIGVGWATISTLDVEPADAPTLTVLDVDSAVDDLMGTTGPGSQSRRAHMLSDLLGKATSAEQDFLARLFIGELRQGALAGVMSEAIAWAAEVPATLLRRAAMLQGDLPATAAMAMSGGEEALRSVGLTVGRAIEPMLASTAPSVAEAVEGIGMASVEWKLDGARIQVHRDGSDVRVFTRNLNDVTERSPETVAAVLTFECTSIVLDGEILGLDDDGRPRAFQDTMSRFGTDGTHATRLTPVFFDVLHLDGQDLIDLPLDERHATIDRVIPVDNRVPRVRTADPEVARSFFDETVAMGHEGVMVKDVSSLYEAGRRRKSWLKVKPVHTFDLVVLAAEWGHGRRSGWLSNLHLGARDGDEFVMVGKTFKGLTDELLTWQTEKLQTLATRETKSTVFVRPELVVEIALDGVQRSTRYPGDIALRFARVKRYRDDKQPKQADTLDALRRLLV